MSNAPLDETSRQGIICASKTDGKIIIPVKANPSTHGIEIFDGTGQPDNGNHGGDALIDENGRFAWVALSSTGDGSKVQVYADPTTGGILVQAT